MLMWGPMAAKRSVMLSFQTVVTSRSTNKDVTARAPPPEAGQGDASFGPGGNGAHGDAEPPRNDAGQQVNKPGLNGVAPLPPQDFQEGDAAMGPDGDEAHGDAEPPSDTGQQINKTRTKRRGSSPGGW